MRRFRVRLIEIFSPDLAAEARVPFSWTRVRIFQSRTMMETGESRGVITDRCSGKFSDRWATLGSWPWQSTVFGAASHSSGLGIANRFDVYQDSGEVILSFPSENLRSCAGWTAPRHIIYTCYNTINR